MKQVELIGLGFTKELVEEDSEVYYYVYESHMGLCLITTQCSDEVSHDNWKVCIFDSSFDYTYSTIEQVEALMDAHNNVDAH